MQGVDGEIGHKSAAKTIRYGAKVHKYTQEK